MEPKAPTDPKGRAALEAKLEAWQDGPYPWMVFDPSSFAMKCHQCIANPSVTGRTRDAWVEKGCERWQEGTLKGHASSRAHLDSVARCKPAVDDAASDAPLIQSLAQSEETMGPIVKAGYAHAEASYLLAQTCGAARQFPGLLNSMSRVADVLGAKSTISVSKRIHTAPRELLDYHRQVL